MTPDTEGKFVPKEKYSDLLQSHYSLCGKVVILEEKLKQSERQASEERERCAKIADSEPWPEGPAPTEVLATSAGLTYEKIVEATVKATRASIARKIREQVNKRICPSGGLIKNLGELHCEREEGHDGNHRKTVNGHPVGW